MDDIVDNLIVRNAKIVALEREQGITAVLRWLQDGTISVQAYKIVSIMLGRADLSETDKWYGQKIDLFMYALLSNRLIVNIVPRAMDELPIRQSRSQPVNPSHVTINGLAHYCTHNASVNNSI